MAAGAHALTEPTARAAALSGPQKALRKLGLLRPIDLALHLPLRYEDRTRLTPLRELRPGPALQTEARIRHVERGFRGRPVLKVTLADDEGALLQLRFFHFRSQQVLAFQIGRRLRVFGEVRIALCRSHLRVAEQFGDQEEAAAGGGRDAGRHGPEEKTAGGVGGGRHPAGGHRTLARRGTAGGACHAQHRGTHRQRRLRPVRQCARHRRAA